MNLLLGPHSKVASSKAEKARLLRKKFFLEPPPSDLRDIANAEYPNLFDFPQDILDVEITAAI